jgi:alkylation response protein AidB-like acyl-CoA dehydrogenase
VDFPVERFVRDAKIAQIYGATDQIQRVVMSRALLRCRHAAEVRPSIVQQKDL